MAKIRISYETPEELEKVKELPVIKSCKVSKNNSGRYKKAYIETSERKSERSQKTLGQSERFGMKVT